MTAALYLARACYRVLVIEKETFGGQITITDEVVSYPGIEKTSGKELTTTMRKQAENFGAEFLLSEVSGLQKTELSPCAELWETITDKGRYQSFGILLATGAHPRMIGFPGEAEFRGHGVSYCATCDGAFYKGKDVAIVGGGNTAVDDAVYLANICRTVYLIHRRDTFRADQVLIDKLHRHQNVKIQYDSVVTRIEGEKKGTVGSVSVQNVKTGEEKNLTVSGVFVAIGLQPNNEIFKHLVQLDENGYIVAGEDCKTSVPGIFVAGDNRTKEIRQLVTAASDGCVSAIGACSFL